MNFGTVTPVLGIFDVDKPPNVYGDFLGFPVGLEHRIGDNFPLYMGLSKGACHMHLSEHYGDACPGGPQKRPCGALEFTASDPFCNRLTFSETLPEGSGS